MNRTEFMRQLEALLQNIPPAEREEALQYYNDYFNDAGAENEQDVIAALGTPARVAQNIKKDIYGSGDGDNTYERASAARNDIVEYRRAESQEKKEEKGMSTGMVVLIVVLCVLASPVLLGTGTGILGVLIGIVAAWFALILGFGVAALCCFAVMVVLIIAGFMCIIPSPLVGISLFGGGLICGGVGVLFLMLAVAMAGIVTPTVCSGIVGLWRSIFGKKESA